MTTGASVPELWGDTGVGFYAYNVRLDKNDLTDNICAQYDNDKCIRKLDQAPVAVQFHEGARVECKLGAKWFQGTVLFANEDYLEDDRPPYWIRLDDQSRSKDGRGGAIEYWGDRMMASERPTQLHPK